MEVTSVQIDKYFDGRDFGICAECSVVLDRVLCIHKVQIIKGKKGEFVAFPNNGSSSVNGIKKYKDIVHPISKELTDSINYEVLNAFHDYEDNL